MPTPLCWGWSNPEPVEVEHKPCRFRGLRQSPSHGFLSDTRDSCGPARSPGRMKNIPSAFPWVCLYLWKPSNCCSFPLWGWSVSQQEQWRCDLVCYGGSFSPSRCHFNPASWFSQLGSSFKKIGNVVFTHWQGSCESREW